MFDNSIPLEQKKINAEACIHQMWFSEVDYETKGNLIKWNPATKTANDREQIFKDALNGRIDVVAAHHTPHILEGKAKSYLQAPSSCPLNQNSLVAMRDFYHQGKIRVEMTAQKICHNVTILFKIEKRGYYPKRVL